VFENYNVAKLVYVGEFSHRDRLIWLDSSLKNRDKIVESEAPIDFGNLDVFAIVAIVTIDHNLGSLSSVTV
jgi:hypothetical protein